jgi:hypothetical protein
MDRLREWMRRRRERRTIRRELRAERKGRFNADALPKETMRGHNMDGNLGGDGG